MPGAKEPVANQMFEPPLICQHRINSGGKDIWGVNYIPTYETGNALLPEPGNFILPLEKLSQWRDIIKAPDLSGIDWRKMVDDDFKRIGTDRKQTAIALNLHMGYFQTLMSVMGFSDGLVAFYEQPDDVHALLHYLSDFYMKVADNVIDLYQPDILTFMDDTAAWGTPFISPDMYQEFILPHHQKWAKRAKDRGLIMTMHNCGKSESFMPMLHEMGISMWDPAQTCNDLAGIKAKFGNSLVITGGWDARDHLLADDVTEEEIRQSVRDTMDLLAPGGGFCWCGGFLSAIDDQKAIRKNTILMDEVKKYGASFYNR
jgi:hypothetical protein